MPRLNFICNDLEDNNKNKIQCYYIMRPFKGDGYVVITSLFAVAYYLWDSVFCPGFVKSFLWLCHF